MEKSTKETPSISANRKTRKRLAKQVPGKLITSCLLLNVTVAMLFKELYQELQFLSLQLWIEREVINPIGGDYYHSIYVSLPAYKCS